MSSGRFYQVLLYFLLGSTLIFYCLHLLPSFSRYCDISLVGGLIFTLFTIGIFYLGNYTASSPNKGLFSAVHLSTIFFKMIFAVLILFLYVQIKSPPTKLFVVPFMLLYLLFTALEVYILTKIGRTETKTKV